MAAGQGSRQAVEQQALALGPQIAGLKACCLWQQLQTKKAAAWGLSDSSLPCHGPRCESCCTAVMVHKNTEGKH